MRILHLYHRWASSLELEGGHKKFRWGGGVHKKNNLGGGWGGAGENFFIADFSFLGLKIGAGVSRGNFFFQIFFQKKNF